MKPIFRARRHQGSDPHRRPVGFSFRSPLDAASRSIIKGKLVTGAYIAGTLIGALLVAFSFLAPNAQADKHKTDASAAFHLDKKFKGKLPITELTEDQAVTHALNRLGYGPRPGDIEKIKQMGLEKWVDQQLDPDSIDDSALNARLERYPTLKMSSKELLEKFPAPAQAAKQEGMTKEEVEQQVREKRRDAMGAVLQTGDENIDKAQLQLAMMQGPGRIIAELSMGKLDRAIYSQRQLEAVEWRISGSITLMFLPIKVLIAGSSPLTFATQFAPTPWGISTICFWRPPKARPCFSSSIIGRVLTRTHSASSSRTRQRAPAFEESSAGDLAPGRVSFPSQRRILRPPVRTRIIRSAA